MSKLNFKMRNIARLPKSKNIVIKITETLIKLANFLTAITAKTPKQACIIMTE